MAGGSVAALLLLLLAAGLAAAAPAANNTSHPARRKRPYARISRTPAAFRLRTSERAALAELYAATNGDEWFVRDGWLDDDVSPCRWTGVECDFDASGRRTVVGLSLGINNLTGVLPSFVERDLAQQRASVHRDAARALRDRGVPEDLVREHIAPLLKQPPPSSLPNLRLFNVQWNRLRGALPRGIAGMPHLQELQLARNQFSGGVPAEYAHLGELRTLELFSNRLTAPLPDLAALKNLTHFIADDNEIAGSVPAWLGSLPQLRKINLAMNRLEGTLPRELGNLSELTYLSVGYNAITGPIPPELAKLSRLEVLRLNNNLFSSTIPDLRGMRALHSLHLEHNVLEGEPPRTLLEMRNLHRWHVCLFGNMFSSVPDWVAREFPAAMPRFLLPAGESAG